MILKKNARFDINFIKKKIEEKNSSKNFFLFIMGMLLSSISISVFYAPYDFAVGGRTGLALIINNFIDIDLSLIIFVISSILLVISFCVYGTEYGSKNILGTILYPIFLKASTLINQVVDFDGISPFVLILFGAVISGVGFGFIKKSGYNSGGFQVLYDIINDKFKISIGTSIIICNMFIMLLNLSVFGISKFIYGFIDLYISSNISDKVMLGISSNKAFYVVTKKPLEVRDYIVNNLNYTVTIVNAKGGYSDKKKKMLLCVIPTAKYPLFRDVVREIDKDVFFLITDCYSISKI